MGLIEDNSDSIAHPILDEADLEFSGFTMTTANNPNNNRSPWQPGQSGNPSGRPRGTRDLAGYVLETTDGGKELVDALVSITGGRYAQRTGAEWLQAREGAAGAASRPVKGHRDAARPRLRHTGRRRRWTWPTVSPTGRWSTCLMRH